MSDDGYVNYFEILGLDESAKPGDVRKNYKKMMKDLIMEIARVEITGERRDKYLLEMAKLNAALYVLHDNETRETYWRQRAEAIQLESQWREAAQNGDPGADALRRSFDSKLRHFLSRYVEEAMLEAGRDKEAVEASNWDAAHERHASRILRHYRHNLYQQILHRLPYWEITTPKIDWAEREEAVAGMLAGER
jgi:DnaJ-class molecular chaperone